MAEIAKEKLEAPACWYNPWWIEDCIEVRNTIERILMPVVEKHANDNIRSKRTGFYTSYGEKVLYTLVSIVASFTESIKKTKYGIIKIHRNDHIYSIRYYTPQEITRQTVVLVLDALLNAGYINQKVGSKYVQYKTSYPTKCEPTRKMKQFLNNHDVSLNKFCVSMDEPVILLRDNGCGLKEFKPSMETQQTERILREFRMMAKNHTFGVANPTRDEQGRVSKADFKNVRMKRVFKGNLTQTGRLYSGFWTNWPEVLRHKITINNEPVIEKDYANLHINMVYVLEGIEPPNGDLYKLKKIDGVPTYRPSIKLWRTLVKRSTNAMLNMEQTAKREGLYGVLYNAVNGEPLKNGGRSTPAMSLPKGFILTKRSVLALRDAILDKHPAIAHRFMCGKDQGSKLQYLDSQMALRLIKQFQSIGILCLSEHDSFIVPASYDKELVAKMQEAFCVVMNTDYRIDVE
ncbi:MAG: hypothetical protein KQI78_12160 [Deltaproteobacteria bacterium]|nr:hypothetical protein [Deltaproteobacteria bacterium]